MDLQRILATTKKSISKKLQQQNCLSPDRGSLAEHQSYERKFCAGFERFSSFDPKSSGFDTQEWKQIN
jgi:hypothetical protein